MKRKGCFFLVLSVGLFAVMTYTKGYFGLSLAFGHEVSGQVVRYGAKSASSDWLMEYQFHTVDGRLMAGTAEFAPKDRPADDTKTVALLFIPWWPQVSVVKGYASLTGIFGYGLSIFLFVSGLRVLFSGQEPAEPTDEPNGASPRRLS